MPRGPGNLLLDHPPHPLGVRVRDQLSLAQPALALGGLLGEDVTRICGGSLDLA